MAFSPDKITKKHVLDGIKRIEKEQVELEPSTRFDVVINGKTYPPKEVMRYAHEEMNGEHIWERSGGEPTNKYLSALGFEIINKSDSNTTELTGNIWKLGCNWGKGAPSFYEFIKKESIVIGEHSKKYQVGDLILICAGQTVNAIARVNETPTAVTSNSDLENPFDELQIEYEDRINYADAEWYVLDDDEKLSYQLQQGIVRVNPNHPVYKQAIQLWDDRNCSYWVFQGNPKDFDFETAIREDLLEEWTVSAHKDKIKIGDKVILWIAGKKSGCYALAVVTSEPKIIEHSKDSHLWKTPDKNPLKAGIKITHNLIDKPITLEEINRKKELAALKVGNQGTNFTATKKEFKTLLEMAKNSNSRKKNYKELYTEWLKSSSSIESNKWTSYIRAIEILSEITKQEIFEEDNFANLDALYEDLLKEQRNDKGKYFYKEAPSYGNSGFYSAAIKSYSDFLREYLSKTPSNKNASNMSLNTILFGPPGTGKTFNSIDKAVEIVMGEASQDHEENKSMFDELRKQKQIEFVTFHQNYSYEDFMVGIKPRVEDDTTSLSFKNHYGIFYRIASDAKENFIASKVAKGKLISVQELMNDFIERLRNGEVVELKTQTKVPFKLKYRSDYSIQIIYSNDSENNTLSVDTLIDIAEGKREYNSSLKSYYYPTKDYLLSKRLDEKAEAVELKKYVLIIDEINRANISKVFGELITLLEDDKRLGEPNELKITLPNGEKEFGVPPNLYIIGTMNTADKSIALIDIALRRRFEFIGYYPTEETINRLQAEGKLSAEKSNLLKNLNKAVYEKRNRSADYLIGHAYFMNNKTVEEILLVKVIPLLMEYFSGKTTIVAEVFSETAYEVRYDEINYKWEVKKK